MSRRSGGTESKPYNPKDDPYFPISDPFVNRSIINGNLVTVAVFVGGGFAAVKKFGWIGLAGIVLVIVIAVTVWLFIRRCLIESAAEPGYVNRHNKVTRECITPLQKKYKEKFYSVECMNCGKSVNVQATRLRGHRCPHCRGKKGEKGNGRQQEA